MSCNYKTNIKDIQSKYTFKIFCAGDTSQIEQEIGNLSDLTTTAKNNLVSAINEVDGELSAKEDKSNKVTTITSSSTDTQYPSAKLLYNQLALKEDVANKTTTLSSSSTDTQYPSAKAVYDSQVTQDETISTLETNLEETQNDLDYYKTIYNVLPKVNGNGESITLDNTGESILKLDTRGQCKQDSTTGKNIANIHTDSSSLVIRGLPFTIDDGVIKVNGTTTQDAGNPTFNFDIFQANSGNAVFSIDVTGYTDLQSGNGSCLLKVSDDGTNFTILSELNYKSTMAKQTQVTLDSSKYYRMAFYMGANNVFANGTIKMQLEYGTTKTDWEKFTYGASPNPDYPQDVHVVSGDNTIEVVGKQLFQSAYLPTPTSAPNAVLKAGTYTIASCDNNNFGKNIYFRLLDMNNNLINESGHITSSNTNINFSTSSYFYLGGQSVSYITFTIDNDYKVGIGILESDNTKQVMLVSGSEVVRTYQPYQSQTYEVDLGTLELCKIGDYQDYFTKNSEGQWCKYNAIGKYTFDGTESWMTNPYGTNAWSVNAITTTYYENKLQVMCETFKGIPASERGTGDNIIFTSSNTTITIRNTTLTTQAEVQSATNGKLLYYALATPYLSLIESETLISQLDNLEYAMSYEGQTNISQVNNDAPFKIYASALMKISGE